MNKVLFASIIFLVGFALLTIGCDEGQQMMKPAVDAVIDSEKPSQPIAAEKAPKEKPAEMKPSDTETSETKPSTDEDIVVDTEKPTEEPKKIEPQEMEPSMVEILPPMESSPLDTIPPPITDFFILANQRSIEPDRTPGDFVGRIYAPKPEDWKTRSDAHPITGITVTIMSGPRSGESVVTNPSGYYRFPNVEGVELHLRVEKEHFEPKEVIVHRSRPTILANGDVPNYTEGPQQTPGNILIGQRWPDEVRFIFEDTLVVHDLLYVEGGRLPKGTDLGGYYSRGIVVIYSYQYADWEDTAGLLGTFAHEIAHAHQHATVSVDGNAWEIHGWRDTPEGIAYAEARRKDWEKVGKAPYDDIYGGRSGGVSVTETAAETCAHYWSVNRWGGRTAYGKLEIEAPNRFKWAEQWFKKKK